MKKWIMEFVEKLWEKLFKKQPKMRGKVLVVEDNLTWSKRLKETLEESGFYVIVKKTKVEALEILEKEYFHFATIDLQLDENTLDDKKFEGWEVMKKIVNKGLTDKMPIMVLTGFPGDEENVNKIKALRKEYNADFFVEKAKWDKKEFIDTVIRAVELMDIQFKDDYKS
jgi:ActR/RegA family two-component response regulator